MLSPSLCSGLVLCGRNVTMAFCLFSPDSVYALLPANRPRAAAPPAHRSSLPYPRQSWPVEEHLLQVGTERSHRLRFLRQLWHDGRAAINGTMSLYYADLICRIRMGSNRVPWENS